MVVSRINLVALGDNSNCRKLLGSKNNVSFTGAPVQAAQAVEKSAAKLTKSARFFTWFNDFYGRKSERNTIIVTAFGTGVVAPIVLAINPISKEDSNTKKYTALRQPLSALFAVVTQVGINAPIPKFMNRLAAAGKFGIDYLPDPKNASSVAGLSEEAKAGLKARLEAALQDDGFRNRIIEYKYKKDLEKIEINATKDISYFERMFNKETRERIKKEIEEKKAKIKKLTYADMDFEKAAKFTAKNLETYKNLVGICASVAVLWPTFALLNYIYPRFVETFFPQLVKEKARKGESPKIADNKANKGGAK